MKEFIGHECSILIVDDDEALLEMVVASLTPHFYKVEGVKSAGDALAYLKNHHIDLVVTDQNMPEMTGAEFAARVRKIYPLMPVIMLTGNGSTPEVIQSLDNGIFDVLDKPFRTRLLVNRIQNALVLPKLTQLLWASYSNTMKPEAIAEFRTKPLEEQLKVLYAYSALMRTRSLKREAS